MSGLFLGDTILGHLLPCLCDLGQNILASNISSPQHAGADSEGCPVSVQPFPRGSDHGEHWRAMAGFDTIGTLRDRGNQSLTS